MRDLLAERLLAQVMEWSPEEVARERPLVQAMASFKYDEYQQFSPGMRYVESLALWLRQFDTVEEKRVAYRFVKERLIFISESEINHLISIVYPDRIRPFLVREVAAETGMSGWKVRSIASSLAYRALLRRCLFLGLSDGARTGVFRRSNAGVISHEQVLQNYEVTSRKAADMLEELRKSLVHMGYKKPEECLGDDSKFKIVFLMDDFSGSGRSYFRRGNEDKFEGKILKVLDDIQDIQNGQLAGIVDRNNLKVCTILYLATDRAVFHLKNIIEEWNHDSESKIGVTFLPVQEIQGSMSISPHSESAFCALLEKHFDEEVLSSAYKKGRHERPYMGFDECALPLVLEHNAPNNSVVLLWYDGRNGQPRALFPRASRH